MPYGTKISREGFLLGYRLVQELAVGSKSTQVMDEAVSVLNDSYARLHETLEAIENKQKFDSVLEAEL